MFPTLKVFNVGAIPWSPLAGGQLARPRTRGEQTKRAESDFLSKVVGQSEAAHAIIDRVEEIARKRDVSMGQIAIAWILSKPGVKAPIIRFTKEENLRDVVEGMHVTLADEEIRYLDEPYVPQTIGHF